MTILAPETFDLESIDLQIPCDVRRNGTPICEKPATWVMRLRGHCKKVLPSMTLLICDEHYEYVTNGGTGACPCGEIGLVLRDYILLLEPL